MPKAFGSNLDLVKESKLRLKLPNLNINESSAILFKSSWSCPYFSLRLFISCLISSFKLSFVVWALKFLLKTFLTDLFDYLLIVLLFLAASEFFFNSMFVQENVVSSGVDFLSYTFTATLTWWIPPVQDGIPSDYSGEKASVWLYLLTELAVFLEISCFSD